MCKSLTIHFGISRARVHFMPSLCLFMQHQTVRRKLVSCCCCCFLSLLVLGPSILQSAAAWNNHRLSMTTTRRTVLQKLILASPFSTLVNVTPSFARNLPEPTTADLSRTGTVEALVPVLRLQDSLSSVELYLSEPGASISGIDSFLKSVPRDETTFKSIFDQYSDPISYKQKFVDQNAFLVYYTKGFDGPGRPSIESDLPVKQTVQYGTSTTSVAVSIHTVRPLRKYKLRRKTAISCLLTTIFLDKQELEMMHGWLMMTFVLNSTFKKRMQPLMLATFFHLCGKHLLPSKVTWPKRRRRTKMPPKL